MAMTGETMDEGMPPAPAEEQAPPAEGEFASVFLSKDSLGGKTYKVGDTITLTVSDVDPETGDIQADLSKGSETTTGRSEGYSEAFDRQVPEGGPMSEED